VVLLQSGGLLDGDSVSIEARVEPGARLSLRTLAATQLHGGCSRQRLSVQVGEAASFSYVPRALVPHAGADHRSQTRIELAPTARVFFSEVLSPGRVAFGEQFAYRRLRLDVDIHSGDSVLARERALIEPQAAALRGMFGPWTHTASAYLLGAPEPPVGVDCTPLANGGYFVRALATRAETLDATLDGLHAAWSRR
jgi:urease accessory protein